MLRFITSIGLVTAIFLCLFSSEVSAQKGQLRDSLVQDFRAGTLIIRLKTHQNKLNSIESVLQRADTSPKHRNRLIGKRDQIIANRDRFNQDLVTAFSQLYSFSEVRFMFDKDVKRFKAGALDGVFLGTDLMPLAESKPVEGSYYFCGEGNTQMPGNSREGILVMDKNGDQLPGWFPNYFRAKSNGRSFFAMFGGDRYPYMPAEKVVKKFMKGLGVLR